MDKFVVRGGKKLRGTVEVSGSKNAALALMPATLLASGVYEFSNVPSLRDITTMSRLLTSMGVECPSPVAGRLRLNTFRVNKFEAPYEHVKKMRASIYVLGPLLARYGEAKVSLPGGCAWGPRPVDLHIAGMKKLGAEIDIDRGYIVARAKRLKGRTVKFGISSVGATGNVLMAAVLARGTTVLENAAIEPEVTALAKFLMSMGARIDGAGTTRMEIEGVDELTPADQEMIPDRIEAGTLLIAGAITGGSIRLTGVKPSHCAALIARLRKAGCAVSAGADWISLKAPARLKAAGISTSPYPGFPTDLQAQWIALMCRAKGESVVTDGVYFDRFKHVPELVRLGAEIAMEENVAKVHGPAEMTGTKVMSTDLRASASLVLAGLAASGRTEVLRVYHLDRGYDHLERKLRALGADIRRVAGAEY
jgi:UDP-N-acetylglucosamine 1-carboxyvinyltransferase